MIFSATQLQQLADLATEAAYAAGEVIDACRDQKVAVNHKDINGSLAGQVVTEVDLKAQAAILEILTPTCTQYDLALLTEESPDQGLRHIKPAFWSIDPLDGTLAFVRGEVGFSVSIALVAQDSTPLIGVVYDPQQRVLYRAIKSQGSTKNAQALQVATLDPQQPLVLSTDYSFQQHPWLELTRKGLQQIADDLGLNGVDVRYRNGGAMNACSVLEQANHCYFKYPRADDAGGSVWDYAATACIYNESSAVATDLYGQAMELNRPGSTFMNHKGILYTAQPELTTPIIQLNYFLLGGRNSGL